MPPFFLPAKLFRTFLQRLIAHRLNHLERAGALLTGIFVGRHEGIAANGRNSLPEKAEYKPVNLRQISLIPAVVPRSAHLDFQLFEP
jgi:hypothetical protein